MDYLQLVSENEAIKVLVVFGSPTDREAKDYLNFYQHVSNWISDQDAIHRIYNAIDQFIMTFRNMDALVIHVERRKRISLFLNMSLACDYSIVAHNAVFQNRHLEIGLLPKGGSAFFLSRLLGFGKACEVLLSPDDIPAQKALRFGIVNKIVPYNELEASALTTAMEFARQPAESLSSVKRLLNYPLKDLERYLAFENDELFRIVNSAGFQRRLDAYISK